jgi:predicted acylesterase/phospholipase RssA
MPGLRVLVLDGGGARGLFTVEVLRYIEMSCGRPIRECFDLIVGTSIGGFIAGLIANGTPIDEMEARFVAMTACLAKAQPTVPSIASRLVWGHVLDAHDWDTQLRATVGEATLAQLPASPRLVLMAADARTVIPHPFLIRNRPLPPEAAARSAFASSSSMRLADALRAVTAAPTIYPAHVVDGIPLVDAGILANNPVLFAIAEATLLGPSLDCVVSIGTGIETRIAHPSPQRGVLGWTWATIKRAADPETAEMLAQGLLAPSQYIRFDPPKAGDCSTWESDPTTLHQWRRQVQTYMHGCQDTLAALVPRLCPENPVVEDNEGRSVSNASGP